MTEGAVPSLSAAPRIEPQATTSLKYFSRVWLISAIASPCMFCHERPDAGQHGRGIVFPLP